MDTATVLIEEQVTVIETGLMGPPGRLHLSATVAWDPPSVLENATTTTTITVPGAVVGDTVAVGFKVSPVLGLPAGVLLFGAVTAAGTVTVTLFNKSDDTVDILSGILRADVWQHGTTTGGASGGGVDGGSP